MDTAQGVLCLSTQVMAPIVDDKNEKGNYKGILRDSHIILTRVCLRET